MQAVSIALGSVVRLRGASRNYTAVVTKSEPNRIWVRIGDDWDNCYDFENGEWVGKSSAPGRSAPRTRLIGILNRAEHVYTSK